MRIAISTRWIARAGALALVGMSLAACGGGNNNSAAVTTTTTTPTPTPTLASNFGANFATDFSAAANSAPAKVAAGDLIAVSFTTAPTALH